VIWIVLLFVVVIFLGVVSIFARLVSMTERQDTMFEMVNDIWNELPWEVQRKRMEKWRKERQGDS